MTNDQNIQRASKLDATALSDALDRLGIAGQCLGIKPLDHGFRLAGRAFTILYGPAGTPPGTVGDYIDDVAPGSVVVLDNGEVMAIAEEIDAKEDQIRRMVQEGKTLAEARRQHGYHQLQTKR